jgi:hypothetical protein
MQATLKDGKLTHVLDLPEAKQSASGTTYMIAGTKRTRFSAVNLDGEPVWVIANAFVYAKPEEQKESSKKSSTPKKDSRK